MIGKINYEKIQTIFNNNASLLSMNKINEFFAKIPAEDRMEVETFMRTELGLNVFDYITVIPKGMFAFNNDLSTITVPNTIMEIEEEAFRGCAAKHIEIQAPISIIKQRTFEGCENLPEIVLPEGVTTLEDEAFKNCSSLESVYLPDSILEIGRNVFVKCSTKLQISMPRAPFESKKLRFANQNEAKALISNVKIR